ncbi:XdhC family protein [Nocardia sp. NPDC004750]
MVERFDSSIMPIWDQVRQSVMNDRTVVMATILSAGNVRHVLVDDDRPSGFVESNLVLRRFDARARLIIIGSTDFALETALLGMRMGYRVTVCDARQTFATPARFPGVDEVVCEWPSQWIARQRDAGGFDDRSVFVILTHDPKIDIPALVECLDAARWAEPPAFVGAMGSATADTNRRRALKDAGITNSQLTALHSPIGLAIGNTGPAETAVSIAAQIIATKSPAAIRSTVRRPELNASVANSASPSIL